MGIKTSVTKVLDYSIPPQLANWFKKNSEAKCEKIGTETARIGQLVDSLIQQDIKENGYVPPEEDEQALNCLAGWELLKKEYPQFVPSVTEVQTELTDGNMVGHPDYVCIESEKFEDLDMVWGITDLKCTSGIRFKNYIQCAKYAKMLMNIRGWKFPSFVRVIRLKREDKTYEWSEIRDPKMIQYFMDLFESYYAIYKSESIISEFMRCQLEDQLLGDF